MKKKGKTNKKNNTEINETKKKLAPRKEGKNE